MSDKRGRDPYADRYGKTAETEETETTEETTEMSQSAETEKTAETAKTSIKERSNVNMYLPDDVVQELSITFDELNAAHKRAHGGPLEKNRDYYPAVVKAGLEGKDVREVLDI